MIPSTTILIFADLDASRHIHVSVHGLWYVFDLENCFRLTNTDCFTAGTSVAKVTASDANPSQLTYIALAFGFSLTVNVWIFFRISGGLFNPAVTLGLYLTDTFSATRALIIFFAQLVAGIVAAATNYGLFPTPLDVSTTLTSGTTRTQGVFIEAILSFELVFTVFMLAFEKHKATFLAPVGIGLALFVAELAGIYYTGGSLNPARSFGPAVVNGVWEDHWVYWVGPLLGSLGAVGFFKLVRVLHYQDANPGQDRDLGETVITVRDDTGNSVVNSVRRLFLVLDKRLLLPN